MDKKLRQKIYERDNYACQYCKRWIKDEDFHIDHVKPKVKGGSNTPDNLVLSCVTCNSIKGDLSVYEFYDKINKRVDFHEGNLNYYYDLRDALQSELNLKPLRRYGEEDTRD